MSLVARKLQASDYVEEILAAAGWQYVGKHRMQAPACNIFAMIREKIVRFYRRGAAWCENRRDLTWAYTTEYGRISTLAFDLPRNELGGARYLIVCGNTYPIRSKLGRLGGEWNANTKDWQIPIEKGRELALYLNGRSGVWVTSELAEGGAR